MMCMKRFYHYVVFQYDNIFFHNIMMSKRIYTHNMLLLKQDTAVKVNLQIQTVIIGLCYPRICIDHGVRTHGINQKLIHRAMYLLEIGKRILFGSTLLGSHLVIQRISCGQFSSNTICV